MDKQLVIQFTGRSLADYDKLIEVETALEERLGSDVDVDGHDFGSTEMNIFIFTSDVEKTFLRVKEILDSFSLLEDMRAACRDLKDESEVFTILWPNGLKVFSVA